MDFLKATFGWATVVFTFFTALFWPEKKSIYGALPLLFTSWHVMNWTHWLTFKAKTLKQIQIEWHLIIYAIIRNAAVSHTDLSLDGWTILQHQPLTVALPVLLVLSDRANRTPAAQCHHPALRCHAPHGGCGVPGMFSHTYMFSNDSYDTWTCHRGTSTTYVSFLGDWRHG